MNKKIIFFINEKFIAQFVGFRSGFKYFDNENLEIYHAFTIQASLSRNHTSFERNILTKTVFLPLEE